MTVKQHRFIQWIAIILILSLGAGWYYRTQTQGAQTVVNDAPSFQADLTSTIDLQKGVGAPTFTRADGADQRATVTDFEGLIRPVKAGEARFEGARRVENLLTYSEAFDNAAWNKVGGTSVTANQATAPNGTVTVDKITTSGAADPKVTQTINTGSALANRTFRLSFWLWTDSGQPTANYQMFMYDGTVTYIGANTLTLSTTPTRYSLLYTFPSGATNTSIAARLDPPDNNPNGNYLYAWGAQLEDVTGQANQNPSEYVSVGVKTSAPYHGANVDGVKYFTTQNGNTVASNVVTEATGAAISASTLKGYLAEGSRTNLLLRSEEFDNASWAKGGNVVVAPTVTADQTAAPDGRTTADKVVFPAVSGVNAFSIVYQRPVQNAADHTASIWLKGNSGGEVVWLHATPNGSTYARTQATLTTSWQRFTVNYTESGTDYYIQIGVDLRDASQSAQGAQTIYAWGAQLEQASFASSYIPTTSASVTRAADSLKYPTSGNVDNVAGSAYAEVTTTASGSVQTNFISTFNGSGGAPLYVNNDGNLTLYDGAIGGRNLGLAVTRPNSSIVKIASKWSGSSAKGFLNGTAGSSATFDGSLSTESTMGIGFNPQGTSYTYGTIKNVKIWKKALTDTQLQNLTSSDTDVSSGAVKNTTIGTDGPSFQADLTSTIDLQKGQGAPTFTRADGADRRATVTDFEGLIRPVKQNEARFEGVRRVENLLSYSEDLSNGAWSNYIAGFTKTSGFSDPGGGLNAWKLDNNGVANSGITQNGGVSGRTYTMSVWLKADTGTAGVAIGIGDSSGVTKIVTTTWTRYSVTGTMDAFNRILKVVVPSSTQTVIYMYHPQVEDVTGQANQNPSEYVSTNVKTSAPYHGANVDGVKYFTTQNGNTVASNVVTEATGSAIADSTLKGYLAEGSRTNLALQSNSFSTSGPWFTQFASLSQNQTGMDGGTTAWTVTDGDSSNTSALFQNFSLTSGTSYAWSMYFKKTVGAQSSYPVLLAAYFTVPQLAAATIDTTNGTATVWTSYTGYTVLTSSATCVSANTNFWRCTLVFTPLTTATHSVYMDPAAASNPTQSSGTVTGSITGTTVIWGAQLEQASFASSYIPTTSASVTRAADSLTYPISGNFTDTIGSSYAEIKSEWTTSSGNNVIIGTGASSAGPMHIGNTLLSTTIRLFDGTNNTDKAELTDISTGIRKRASSWNGVSTSITGDGLSVTHGVFDGNLGNSGLGIGVNPVTSGAQLFGTIKSVKIWKKALTDTQLQNLTSTNDTVSRSAVKQTAINVNQNSKLTSGLVGLWSFNGPDISGTTAYDRSGQNNNGTLSGGPAKTPGKVGQALSFDGSDDYVKVPDSDSLDVSDQITISFWAKPGATQLTNADILSKHGGGSGYVVEQYGSSTNQYYFAWGNGTGYSCSALADTISLSSGVWQHVTFVKSGVTVTQYINGQNVDSCTGSFSTIAATTNDVYLSRFSNYAGRYFNGSLDEVRIYNRALSATEVSALYNMGR